MPDEPVRGRTNDVIAEEISAALDREPGINLDEIDIDVDRGVVSFNGTVDNYTLKERVHAIAERIEGVTDVQYHLRIRKDAGVLRDVRPKSRGTAS